MTRDDGLTSREREELRELRNQLRWLEKDKAHSSPYHGEIVFAGRDR